MKERLLIIGSGAKGEQVLDRMKRNYSCGYIDGIHPFGDQVKGVPVAGDLDDLFILHSRYPNIIIAIDAPGMHQYVQGLAEQIGYCILPVPAELKTE